MTNKEKYAVRLERGPYNSIKAVPVDQPADLARLLKNC